MGFFIQIHPISRWPNMLLKEKERELDNKFEELINEKLLEGDLMEEEFNQVKKV